MKKLSWKPVRKGRVFCAPACGSGCTREAYLKAKAAARKLCATLGPGWKPSVSENMGWHYSAILGVMTVVLLTGDDTYTAYFNGPTQFLGHAKSPRKAVEMAYFAAERAVKAQAAANLEIFNYLARG